MLGRWRSGTLKLIDEGEGRGRSLELIEMADVSLASVWKLYGIEPTEEKK